MNENQISEDEMSREELLSALEEAKRLIESDSGPFAKGIYCPNYLKWETLYKNKFFKSHKV
jgi:hypothetical protein